MNEYTLYWRDGKREIVCGSTPVDAMNRAGYGNGALPALDFFSEGQSDYYTWNAATRQWEKANGPDA